MLISFKSSSLHENLVSFVKPSPSKKKVNQVYHCGYMLFASSFVSCWLGLVSDLYSLSDVKPGRIEGSCRDALLESKCPIGLSYLLVGLKCLQARLYLSGWMFVGSVEAMNL
ncbi:hypothetical protein IFM89_032620 [Coptis chinensis]|uniref:Uncharacterized protein n=1 Tax=Coptis chinensis TaxID=261450 RepID=A0A835IGP0_9MAGN|nr:hypothetical protein IFM89_032620 [Coptis chinensis]